MKATNFFGKTLLVSWLAIGAPAVPHSEHLNVDTHTHHDHTRHQSEKVHDGTVSAASSSDAIRVMITDDVTATDVVQPSPLS